MPPTSPRIPNLPPERWTDEVKAIFPMMVPPGSPVKGSDFNSILMFVNNVPLAKPWLQFSLAQGRDFTLAARYREIATLRIAHRFANEYEWVHHIFSGSAAGLTPDHYRAVQQGADAAIWSDLERAIVRCADLFCERTEIDQPTWDALAAELPNGEILELFFVIGSYFMLAWTFNSVGVELEAGFADKARAMGYPMLHEA